MVFKLNSLLGASTVSYIEFEIDEAAVLEARRSQGGVNESELRRLAELEITPELQQAAAKIEDEELRKQFLAAAGNCLVRKARTESRI